MLANLRRSEVLDFVERDYPQYAWSLGTLSRRMNHFGIKYVDYSLTVAEVEEAVCEENDGPGQLLGYRALQKKIRQQHQLAVPRALVYDVLTKVDPEGLERRWNVGRTYGPLLVHMVPPFANGKDPKFCLQINGNILWEWRKLDENLEKLCAVLQANLRPNGYRLEESAYDRVSNFLNTKTRTFVNKIKAEDNIPPENDKEEV